MSYTEPLLIQKLATQMSYLNQRQTLLAQNIANIDTPNYQAQDLKKLDFNDMAAAESNRLEMRTTSPKHLSSAFKSGTYRSEKDRLAFEKKPVGNNVVLDEQMGKISDIGAQSQLSTTLFHKFNQLYRAAVDNKAS